MTYRRPTYKESCLNKARDILNEAKYLHFNGNQDGAHNLSATSIILSALSTVLDISEGVPHIENLVGELKKQTKKSELNHTFLCDVEGAINARNFILNPNWCPTLSDTEKMIEKADKTFEFVSTTPKEEKSYQSSI